MSLKSTRVSLETSSWQEILPGFNSVLSTRKYGNTPHPHFHTKTHSTKKNRLPFRFFPESTFETWWPWVVRTSVPLHTKSRGHTARLVTWHRRWCHPLVNFSVTKCFGVVWNVKTTLNLNLKHLCLGKGTNRSWKTSGWDTIRNTLCPYATILDSSGTPQLW